MWGRGKTRKKAGPHMLHPADPHTRSGPSRISPFAPGQLSSLAQELRINWAQTFSWFYCMLVPITSQELSS